MSERILAVNLKKKYSQPRRACDASGADIPEEYCVGGALCIEVFGEKAMHFPDYECLLQSVLRANEDVDYYAMSDQEHNAFRSKLAEVVERNDIGDFDGAWRAMEELLNWPATEPKRALSANGRKRYSARFGTSSHE